MVNSGSFSSEGDRNTKASFIQTNNSNSSQSISPITASGAVQCKNDFIRTADSSLPCELRAIEPIPSKTDFHPNKTTMTVQNFHQVDNNKLPNTMDVEKTSLFCSLPLDKVQSILSTFKNEGNNIATKEKNTSNPTRKVLCLYCDRTFVSNMLKEKHVERCHSTKQFRRVSSRRQQNNFTSTPCVYCDQLTATEHTLKELFQHLVKVHSNKYFGCLTCEERFLNASHLGDHHASNHRVTTTNEVTVKKAEPTCSLPSTTTDTVVDIPVKLTRSRIKNSLKMSTEIAKIDTKKRLHNKRLVVKTKVGLKRSKRLQAKLVDNNKKKKTHNVERKEKSTKSTETTEPIEKSSKLPSTSINPYPEFDSFFRVKKITDHSIDNLKISSLTFDDVFDKAFFNRIRCNIQENLLHHIDGKLFKNEESESRISNFEKTTNLNQEVQNSNSENYGCELSLNAVTPAALLLSSTQFGEDLESQIEYGSKPSKKKTQIRKDEVHYKYFTRRKYQASILEHKENRDLSKLDMWTQYVVKNRQQKIVESKRTPKEVVDYMSGEEYKSQKRREELNRILDRRGPFEDLREEATKKAALDKLNASQDETISEESFLEIRHLLNNILDRVCEMDQILVVEPEVTKSDLTINDSVAEIPSYLNLKRTSNAANEVEIDKSDRIALICSSQETENFELPTNSIRDKNEKVELTGEWARSRIYVCAACGLKLQNMKQLLEHKSAYHQYVWVQHYEFVGNQSELYRHLSIPSLGKVGYLEENVQCKLWKRSDSRLCTKCGKQCNSLGELHRHILECGGDWTWMLARKKCKYRPFGAKSRRKRRGLIKRIYPQKSENSEKKVYKKAFDGPRPKPSDAESIQRMLANLPAKRASRKLISLKDGFHNYRQRKINQAAQQQPQQQQKMKCGKLIRRRLNVGGSTQISSIPNKTHPNTRKRNSLNKVISSRILDTNSTLMVKRKLKNLGNRRITRQLTKHTNVDEMQTSRKSTPKPMEVVEEEEEEENEHLIVNEETHAAPITDNNPIDSSIKEIKPKRTSPRIDKKSTDKVIAEKISIKRFFSVKKKSSTANNNIENMKTKTNKRRANKSEFNPVEEEPPPSTHNKAKESFSNLVRTLSLRRKKLNKDKVKEIKVTKKLDEDSEKPLDGSKRKLRSSFKEIVKKIRNIKENDNENSIKENNRCDFLDEPKINETNTSPNSEKIVIPEVTPEIDTNLVDIPIPAPIVVNYCVTSKTPPLIGTVFDLQTNNEKILQAKGEQELFEPTNNIQIDTNVDHLPLKMESKLISPKGKIKKPTRGLNDCIAMLTNKLNKNLGDSKCVDSIFSLMPSANSCEPVRGEVNNKKTTNCELIVPFYPMPKTDNLLLSSMNHYYHPHTEDQILKIPNPIKSLEAFKSMTILQQHNFIQKLTVDEVDLGGTQDVPTGVHEIHDEINNEHETIDVETGGQTLSVDLEEETNPSILKTKENTEIEAGDKIYSTNKEVIEKMSDFTCEDESPLLENKSLEEELEMKHDSEDEIPLAELIKTKGQETLLDDTVETDYSDVKEISSSDNFTKTEIKEVIQTEILEKPIKRIRRNKRRSRKTKNVPTAPVAFELEAELPENINQQNIEQVNPIESSNVTKIDEKEVIENLVVEEKLEATTMDISEDFLNPEPEENYILESSIPDNVLCDESTEIQQIVVQNRNIQTMKKSKKKRKRKNKTLAVAATNKCINSTFKADNFQEVDMDIEPPVKVCDLIESKKSCFDTNFDHMELEPLSAKEIYTNGINLIKSNFVTNLDELNSPEPPTTQSVDESDKSISNNSLLNDIELFQTKPTLNSFDDLVEDVIKPNTEEAKLNFCTSKQKKSKSRDSNKITVEKSNFYESLKSSLVSITDNSKELSLDSVGEENSESDLQFNGMIKENHCEEEFSLRRRSQRSAKTKALEIIIGDALCELTESERNIKNDTAVISGKFNNKNATTREKKRRKQSLELKLVDSTLNNELSKENSVTKEISQEDQKEIAETPLIKNDVKSDKATEKKLSADELFDLLKAAPRENITLPKISNSFAFTDEISDDFNDDNFDALENILEKSIAVIEENLAEKSLSAVSSNTGDSNISEIILDNSDAKSQIKTKKKRRKSKKCGQPQLNITLENVVNINVEELEISDNDNRKPVLNQILHDSSTEKIDEIIHLENDTVNDASPHKELPLEANETEQQIVEDNEMIKTKQNKMSKSKVKRNETEIEKSAYCEICDKSFRRVDNLIKHKRTLTHISKLSEIEAKEAAEKAKNTPNNNDLEVKHNIDNFNIFKIDNSVEDEDEEEDTSNLDSASLKLADIISDVLNKPVLNRNEEKHNFSDIIMQNCNNDQRPRYRSLGERKSFDAEHSLTLKSVDYFEPQISKTAGTILEKQISLLENIIENRSNYVNDVSLSSNQSNNEMISEASIEKQDLNLFSNTTKQNSNNSMHIQNTENDSFLKPNQYEEISGDSVNRTYDEQKSRKALNRDEELFLECCSLLKSGSEISNYSKKSNTLSKVLNGLELKSNEEEGDWLENKSLSGGRNFRNVEDYSDNTRIPTPLGDNFANDNSNSNTISSNWNLEKETTINLENEEKVQQKKNNGELIEDLEVRSFVFEEIEEEQSSKKVEVEEVDEVAKFSEIISKAVRKEYNNSTNRLKSLETSSKAESDHDSSDEVEKEKSEENPEETGSTKDWDNKKLITKGAMKIFEGLKVSIPTEDININQVLNTNLDFLKSVKNSNDIIKPAVEKLPSPKPITLTKPKSLKKKFEISSIFRIKKKSIIKSLKKKKLNKTNSISKSHDIYDFEETQDNSDVFTKPDFRTFRTMKTEEVKKNEVVIVNHTESDNEGNSNGFEALSSSTSSISDLPNVKKKPSENITKKKCMIMGRIFKNAVKSRSEDDDIRDIPVVDNTKLVEEFVMNCNESKDVSLVDTDELNADKSESDKKSTSNKLENNGNKKKLKLRTRKRNRTKSESTDDEFSLNNTVKKRNSKKNNKIEDNSINLEQELKECIGVASRKSQRKCTSGKQNVLVEYWSSDESLFEALLESQIIEPKPKIDKPVNNIIKAAEIKKVDKIDKLNKTESVKQVESVEVVEEIKAKEVSVVRTEKLSEKKVQEEEEEHIVENRPEENEEITVAMENIIESKSSRRKRAAANPLYHWSSSSEDESCDLIEVKPIRDELEDEEDRPVQHGWIVGDSPKKLVTMLAQAKGKKCDSDCVKEQKKKRTFS